MARVCNELCFAKDHPNLVFIWWSACDTDRRRSIYILSNNMYKDVFSEGLQEELKEDYADFSEQTGNVQEYVPEEFEKVWNKFQFMQFDELNAFIDKAGHCYD